MTAPKGRRPEDRHCSQCEKTNHSESELKSDPSLKLYRTLEDKRCKKTNSYYSKGILIFGIGTPKPFIPDMDQSPIHSL